jgi:hypothetical protein
MQVNKITENLQQQIIELTGKGYIVLTQNEVSAQLKREKKFSIGWAIFWTIITWGPGFFCYFIYYWLVKKDEYKFVNYTTEKSIIEKI